MEQNFFRGMDYVYEVYKLKSFSKAASKLCISQPSLSANVKRVEQAIGNPIFDRSTKPLELTECGEEYIRTVERIKACQDEFSTFINDLNGLRTGKLVLGGSNFFSSWVLPPIVSKFSEKYPDLDISLREEKSLSLARGLQAGEIDFIIDNKELDLDIYDRHQVGTEEMFLVVPRHWSINDGLEEYEIPRSAIIDGSFRSDKYKPVDVSLFSKCPFLTLRQINDTGRRAHMICQEYGFKPNVLFELDQQLTAFNVASSGAGATFSGDVLLSRVPDSDSLVYYKTGSKYNERNIYFYWKKGRYMSQAMRAFLQEVVYQTVIR